MAQSATGTTAAPQMQMSPERAHEVVLMTQQIRRNFPEISDVPDDQLLYTTWRSFKRINQTSDSDYHTMAKVFFREFDRHLLNYQFSKAGEEVAVRRRFFAILTDLFQ
ncbi:hypothetical protein RIN67_05410 [Levilactobacillus namurensis]|uniref:hypothetical protein n=1 Tax=Levilactobacillus namurensis TaxID=380393 RepID=UPI0028BC8E7F|nr:hypothetical protein [Levilactobacillus namurensis]MDT7018872.1 hypothetical protein [Levilactobacillus namurensis]WNN66514.1 hypothetical protein RIN67_05410 [Levilactobacillus namurensis]